MNLSSLFASFSHDWFADNSEDIMEYMLFDDGLFLSSSVDVGLMTASRVKANGGIVSLPDVKIFQEASSFLKFSLRFSAHSDIDETMNSTYFAVESNHIRITYPNPFVPSIVADSTELEPAFPETLTVRLVDGAGNDLQMSAADIAVDLRLGSSSSVACCGKSVTVVSSGSRLSASSFKFPSAKGVSFIRDIVPVHVAGEDYFFRFSSITDLRGHGSVFDITSLFDRQHSARRSRCRYRQHCEWA